MGPGTAPRGCGRERGTAAVFRRQESPGLGPEPRLPALRRPGGSRGRGRRVRDAARLERSGGSPSVCLERGGHRRAGTGAPLALADRLRVAAARLGVGTGIAPLPR